MILKKLVTTLTMLLFYFPAIGQDKEIATLFFKHEAEGTMVLRSLNTQQTYIHNAPRANQRFPTASTFKILNTLISLEEKVVTGKDDVFKWDGYEHDFLDWNRDQTLESAFKVSCVWCYQSLARQIGVSRYQHYLSDLNYGQLREPFELTTFWLDGSLQISAMEQVSFLQNVYLRNYPFSASTYDTLQTIMLVEKNHNYSIRAKTGWAAIAQPEVGWYVGYVETTKDVWFFATNVEVRKEGDLALRQTLTQETLKMKGIIE